MKNPNTITKQNIITLLGRYKKDGHKPPSAELIARELTGSNSILPRHSNRTESLLQGMVTKQEIQRNTEDGIRVYSLFPKSK